MGQRSQAGFRAAQMRRPCTVHSGGWPVNTSFELVKPPRALEEHNPRASEPRDLRSNGVTKCQPEMPGGGGCAVRPVTLLLDEPRPVLALA